MAHKHLQRACRRGQPDEMDYQPAKAFPHLYLAIYQRITIRITQPDQLGSCGKGADSIRPQTILSDVQKQPRLSGPPLSMSSCTALEQEDSFLFGKLMTVVIVNTAETSIRLAVLAPCERRTIRTLFMHPHCEAVHQRMAAALLSKVHLSREGHC